MILKDEYLKIPKTMIPCGGSWYSSTRVITAIDFKIEEFDNAKLEPVGSSFLLVDKREINVYIKEISGWVKQDRKDVVAIPIFKFNT